MLYGMCAGSIQDALDLGAKYELSAMQIFTSDPYKFKTSLDEAFALSDIVKASPVKLVSHASLVTNLVSDKAKTRTFSINSLVVEMARCRVLNIDHVVVHPGSSPDGNAIEYLADAISQIISKVEAKGRPIIKNICIENMVDSGDHIMTHPEDFIKFFNLESVKKISNIGMTLDTAHCWGAGVKPSEFIKALEDAGVADRLRVVHYNNTLSTFNSHKERHSELSSGQIPEEETKFMAEYLKSRDNIVVIEEQPKNSNPEITIKYLKECLT